LAGVASGGLIEPGAEEIRVDALEHVGWAEQHGDLPQQSGFELHQHGSGDAGNQEDGDDRDRSVGAPWGQGRHSGRDRPDHRGHDEPDRDDRRQAGQLLGKALGQIGGHQHSTDHQEQVRAEHQDQE